VCKRITSKNILNSLIDDYSLEFAPFSTYDELGYESLYRIRLNKNWVIGGVFADLYPDILEKYNILNVSPELLEKTYYEMLKTLYKNLKNKSPQQLEEFYADLIAKEVGIDIYDKKFSSSKEYVLRFRGGYRPLTRKEEYVLDSFTTLDFETRARLFKDAYCYICNYGLRRDNDDSSL
jgi:hypothetical protein